MSLPRKPINVGVVGADPRGFGARAHIPAVVSSPHLHLYAICTRHSETAEAAAELHGADRWFEGVDAMLEDGEVDLVTVAVRPSSHRSIVEASVATGTAVYCEWPLALNTVEAELMARSATDNAAPNAVGLQGRFSPALQRVRDLVASGAIGRPVDFSASLIQAPFQVDSDRVWLTRASEASGALYVSTAHVADIVQFVLGDFGALVADTATVRPSGVLGDSGEPMTWETHDTVRFIARLRMGISGLVEISNAASHAEGFFLRILGDAGQIEAKAPQYPQFSPVTLTITDPDGQSRTEAPPDIEGEAAPSSNVERALNAFALSMAQETAFEPGFSDAVQLHRLLDAITESATTEKWVVVAGA